MDKLTVYPSNKHYNEHNKTKAVSSLIKSNQTNLCIALSKKTAVCLQIHINRDLESSPMSNVCDGKSITSKTAFETHLIF